MPKKKSKVCISDRENIISKTCRTCATYITDDETKLTSIFSEIISSSDEGYLKFVVLDQLNLLNIKIEEDDGLPQKICHKCINKLHSIEEFRKLCLKSEEVLRNNLLNTPKAVSKKATKNQQQNKNEKEECSIDVKIEPYDEKFDFIDVSEDCNNTEQIENSIKLEITSCDLKIESLDDNENDDIGEDLQVDTELSEYHNQDDMNDDKPFECWYCEKSFKNASQLKNHEHTHNELKISKCQFCNKTFKTSDQYENHLKKHKVCRFCGKNFSKQSLLMKHEETHGIEESGHQCEYCGQIFAQLSRLRFHIKLVHTSKEVRKLQQPKSATRYQSNYKCPNTNCEQSFIIPSALERHMKLHNKNRKFQCTMCDFGYNRAEHLQRHINSTHLKNKTYECPYCLKKFLSMEVRNKHVKSHDAKEYKCEKCDKVYASLKYYTVHQRLHSGEKPAMCVICGKTFPCNNYLKNHQKEHTAEEHEQLKSKILSGDTSIAPKPIPGQFS